jgi:GTPase SAR1 family protein
MGRLLPVLVLAMVLPAGAMDIKYDKHGLLFTYPDTYRLKVVEKKAVRVILDSNNARVGITIINNHVPQALHTYVLEAMKRELASRGMKKVTFTRRKTVLLPFRNIKQSGSAFRSRYKKNKRFITTYIYIFTVSRKTYMVAMTDKLGSNNTFDFFLETFRIRKTQKGKE